MMTSARFWLFTAALLGALAVAFGAFGAHALKARLSPELMQVYQTGVQYQFYHVLALLAAALLMQTQPTLQLATACLFFCSGIFLFSGSLYVLALSGIKILGAITPFGGLAFIAGWVALAWHARNM